MQTWKDALQDTMPGDLAHEIDIFEGQMELMRQGKLDERVFAETRLRRGAYGQRYDNGQRHDGVETQTLDYPQEYIKGPDTLWDAPGMMRIKIPFGELTYEQMEVLAEVADEYSDGILHITTRQDIQLHYVHIEDTPDLMRRLASVGITTREACGNTVRNVTGCLFAGVCRTEPFDVTPYAHAMAYFLLGHDDAQDFGRKVKVAFSGCVGEACGLARMHDFGLVAQTREVDGEVQRGFTMYVGGGLGAIPYQAKVLDEFIPEDEILPIAQAMCRVFARLGEKRNRNRARIKFLVDNLGIEDFREKVFAEREKLPHDDRWTAYLDDLPHRREEPLHAPILLNGQDRPDGFDDWFATNVYRQRQSGYVTATVNLPLGDLTSAQILDLADVARTHSGQNLRLSVEQNIVVRWVSEGDLPALYRDLKAIGLGDAGAGSIVDLTACPGTDTCKLGIASSRGLAGELLTQLTAKSATLPDAIKDLKIKISGCFNSCGQHHVADIGFYGNSRKVGNYKVPFFQVVLGGEWSNNAGSYGLAMGSVPSKSVPDVLDAITNRFVEDRERGEKFKNWVGRIGKRGVRDILEPFMVNPVFEKNPEFFSDWSDPRIFTLDDLGVGECAGEVVSLFSIEVAKAESENFEAQVALEEGDYAKADHHAYRSMLLAARALIRGDFPDVTEDPDDIVSEFRTRFYDTKLFHDKFAKGKFAQYLFNRHENPPTDPGAEWAHRLIEEAQLFIENAHACDLKINSAEEKKAASGDGAPPKSGKLPPGYGPKKSKLPPGYGNDSKEKKEAKLPPGYGSSSDEEAKPAPKSTKLPPGYEGGVKQVKSVPHSDDN
ncbi:MAG: nitrite/sulfite reductase [Rhodothermales bacterium]